MGCRMQLQEVYDRRNRDRHFAWQKSLGPNVRFGSKADIRPKECDVRLLIERRDVRCVPQADMAARAIRLPWMPGPSIPALGQEPTSCELSQNEVFARIRPPPSRNVICRSGYRSHIAR